MTDESKYSLEEIQAQVQEALKIQGNRLISIPNGVTVTDVAVYPSAVNSVPNPGGVSIAGATVGQSGMTPKQVVESVAMEIRRAYRPFHSDPTAVRPWAELTSYDKRKWMAMAESALRFLEAHHLLIP